MGASVSLAFATATNGSATLESRRRGFESELAETHAVLANPALRVLHSKARKHLAALERAARGEQPERGNDIEAERVRAERARKARELEAPTRAALGDGWLVNGNAEYGTIQASRVDGAASLAFSATGDNEGVITIRVQRPTESRERYALLRRLARAIG